MNPSKPQPPATGKPAAAPAKPGAPGASPPTSRARPATVPPAGRPGVAPTPSKPNAPQPAGKVVHDKRGTAVWDWLAQTGRMAIESTTRMLRKLETPELKIEQTHEEELRITPESNNHDKGGGYDPYNQANRPRRSGK